MGLTCENSSPVFISLGQREIEEAVAAQAHLIGFRFSNTPYYTMSSRYERLLFKTGKTARNPFITRTSSSLWKMKPTGRSINNSAVRQEYVVKRRSRIDLGNQHVKKSDNEGRDAGLLQEAVNSTSQQDDNSLPTKFGKKYVRRDNRMPKYLRGEGSSDRTERRPVIDPFDICLPNSSKSSVQKTMSLENNMEQDSEIEYPIIETRQILRPGMILLTNYISLGEQVEIINKCRELGVGPGGFYQPGYQDGTKLRLRMMCLGKKWDPETKYEEQIRSDDSEPVGIPAEFVLLVERALSDSHTLIKKHRAASKVEEILPGMIPDICIVNFYTTNGKLGLHQDRDESRESLSRGLPVVSFSVGDSAEFLYGDQRNVNKAERILLRSGDVLIFGGNSRHIFHGVTSIVPNSAPPALLKEAKLRPGRLNLTFRQY